MRPLQLTHYPELPAGKLWPDLRQLTTWKIEHVVHGGNFKVRQMFMIL